MGVGIFLSKGTKDKKGLLFLAQTNSMFSHDMIVMSSVLCHCYPSMVCTHEHIQTGPEVEHAGTW